MSRRTHVDAQANGAPAGKGAGHVRVAVDTPRVIWWIFGFWLTLEIVLVVVDYLVMHRNLTTLDPLRQLFSLEREDGIGNWLASLQTFLVSLTLWAICWRVRRQARSRGRFIGWGLLAVFFTYLAVDDGAMVHERIGSATVDWLNRATGPLPAWLQWVLELFPTYMWHLVFDPLFAAIGVFMLGFLLRELKGFRPFVLLGMWCFILAVGLDVLDGLGGLGSMVRSARIAEEFVEMLGFTILWIAFLKHLFRITGTLTIELQRPPEPA